jgi:hypothetical protein
MRWRSSGHPGAVDAFPDTMRRTRAIAEEMQGLSEADAVAVGTEAGLEVVVTKRGTTTLMYRTKLDPRRVRLNVQGGVVVATDVG